MKRSMEQHRQDFFDIVLAKMKQAKGAEHTYARLHEWYQTLANVDRFSIVKLPN